MSPGSLLSIKIRRSCCPQNQGLSLWDSLSGALFSLRAASQTSTHLLWRNTSWRGSSDCIALITASFLRAGLSLTCLHDHLRNSHTAPTAMSQAAPISSSPVSAAWMDMSQHREHSAHWGHIAQVCLKDITHQTLAPEAKYWSESSASMGLILFVLMGGVSKLYKHFGKKI